MIFSWLRRKRNFDRFRRQIFHRTLYGTPADSKSIIRAKSVPHVLDTYVSSNVRIKVESLGEIRSRRLLNFIKFSGWPRT